MVKMNRNISAGENAEQSGSSGNHFEKWFGPKSIKAEHYAHYDSLILLLATETTEMGAHAYQKICVRMFKTLFLIDTKLKR